MPEMTTYAPGTPCWVDLSSPDLDAAVDFYGALLGWDVPPSENPEQTGGYRQAMVNGRSAAGLMPLMQEGQPTAWSTYVSVEDADATATKVKEADGQVVVEPMDVMDLGRMAMFGDPTGGFFGVWQPGSFPGAGIVNEPGTLAWNELATRDPDRAKEFYGAVFGWQFRDFGEQGNYWTIHLGGDDHGVGGVMDMRGMVPDEVPPNWLVYFAVDDVDAAAEKATSSGASVANGPMDIPNVGRFAVLIDPHGAAFGLWKNAS
jgi:predicted enzyme related to lactoylglutathione lyase